jgi:hypothetical protein
LLGAGAEPIIAVGSTGLPNGVSTEYKVAEVKLRPDRSARYAAAFMATSVRLSSFGVMMPRERMIKIELLPEEQALLLKYGYPFEHEKKQLEKMVATGDIGVLKIKPFYLSRTIGDLSYSINKRTKGRVQSELNELCERLEYAERTGDGELVWL